MPLHIDKHIWGAESSIEVWIFIFFHTFGAELRQHKGVKTYEKSKKKGTKKE